MQRPVWGPSSKRPTRVFAPLALALTLIASGCASRASLSIQHDAGVMEMPPGCEQTVCDYLYERCADPCSECWESCGREDDQFSVIECSQACNEVCSPGTVVSPLAACETELTACRGTARNTVCIDHLREDMPRDRPACSPGMKSANCACGADSTCLGALDRLNHKCRKCNQQWVLPCIETACKKQNDAHAACMSAHRCASVSRCDDCQGVADALLTCVKNAQQDPGDVGGCYSGPRRCSGEQSCTYVPF